MSFKQIGPLRYRPRKSANQLGSGSGCCGRRDWIGGQSAFFPEAGGLMAWSPHQEKQLRIAVRYVDQILKGARPGDLPIRHPERYSLILNTRAAGDLLVIDPAALQMVLGVRTGRVYGEFRIARALLPVSRANPKFLSIRDGQGQQNRIMGKQGS